MNASVQPQVQEDLDRHGAFYTQPLWEEVRGLATAYRRAGRGETVVYLHGTGLTRRWLPLYEKLAEDFDFVAPEHPGFGDTPLPPWLHSVDDVVLHYDDLFERLGLDRVHLVGHSVGGWIAAEFSVFFPRRVKSLNLIAPIGLRLPGHPLYDLFRMTEDEAPDILWNGRPDAFRDYLDHENSVSSRVHAYQEATALGRMFWNPRYDVTLDRRLQRVSCRANIIAGEDDRVVPREHCQRYAELIGDASFEIIAGDAFPSGHMLVAQEPGKVAAAISRVVNDSSVRHSSSRVGPEKCNEEPTPRGDE